MIPEPARSPPRSGRMTSPPTEAAKAATPAESKIEAPVVPRGPAGSPSESPSPWATIPFGANPGWIVVARPIHHHPVFNFRTHVTWRIALIHFLGCRAIDLNVSQVVQRRTGRD